MSIAYCSADDLKSPLRTVGHSTRIQDDVTSILLAASRWMDRYFHLVDDAFAQATPATRRFDVGHQKGAVLHLDMPLLQATTVLNGSGNSVPLNTIMLIPRNDLPAMSLRLSSGSWIASYTTEIAVTGLWGYATTVPDLVREATALLAVWIINEYQNRRGTEGLSLEKEGEIKNLDVPPLLDSLLMPINNHLRRIRFL
jgi:hypothetical protein